MNRLAFDTLAAAILAVTAALGAYAPVLLSQRDRKQGGSGRSMAYVLGNLFSAGVMVSAGLCHLLGEALRAMPSGMTFPLAPFLCGAGYILTLVADKIAAKASGHAAAAASGGDAAGCSGHAVPIVLMGVDASAAGGSLPRAKVSEDWGPGPDLESQRLLTQASSTSPEKALPISTLHSESNGHLSTVSGRHAHAAKHGLAGEPGGASPSGEQQQQQQRPAGWQLPPTASGALETDCTDSEAAAAATAAGGSVHRAQRLGASLRSTGTVSSIHVSFITAVLMGVALCFHSLLEGAAMGAQQTISNSLHIFIAIVSHKGLAAYALGSSIVDSGASTRRFWSVVLPFTLASPLGIFIGLIISDVAQGVGAASISALASGTFLYVAFMEVIPRELRDPAHTASKLGALVLGFALMSVLAIWA